MKEIFEVIRADENHMLALSDDSDHWIDVAYHSTSEPSMRHGAYAVRYVGEAFVTLVPAHADNDTQKVLHIPYARLRLEHPMSLVENMPQS